MAVKKKYSCIKQEYFNLLVFSFLVEHVQPGFGVYLFEIITKHVQILTITQNTLDLKR